MALSGELERNLATALGTSASVELLLWCRRATERLDALALEIEGLKKNKADKPDKTK